MPPNRMAYLVALCWQRLRWLALHEQRRGANWVENDFVLVAHCCIPLRIETPREGNRQLDLCACG